MLALYQRFVLANSQLGGVHRRKQISSLEGRLGGRTSALEACKGCRVWGRGGLFYSFVILRIEPGRLLYVLGTSLHRQFVII